MTRALLRPSPTEASPPGAGGQFAQRPAIGPPGAGGGGTRRALVVVPGSVNYFYNQAGSRIAEALRAQGVAAEVHQLRSAPDGEYDWCFFVNLYELGVGYGDASAALRRVERLRERAGCAAAVLIDCARTHWFANAIELCRQTGVRTLLDLGLHNQSADLPTAADGLYRFVLNGLTDTEREAVRAAYPVTATGRPIPWVFVGHAAADRVELVRRLVQEVDPAGFVYLPRLAPVTETGPHLNERQFQRLLAVSRCQVWCSHHEHFYMEGERFRNSALAGCLPVKVVRRAPPDDARLPFRQLLVQDRDVGAALAGIDAEAAWRAFADEFCALPSLGQGLAEAMAPLPAVDDRQPGTAGAPFECKTRSVG